MSTFIIRVLKAHSGTICGQIEHVRSGERSAFTSADQLLTFFQQMNAADGGTIVHLTEQEDLPEGSRDDRGPRKGI